MISALYDALANIGYSHPLHPAATHIPVGLIIGGFIFAVAAAVRNHPSLAKTARHCFWLALLVLPVTAENIASQITAPFDSMPAFTDMTEEEINALVEYMKTL